jgi:hypothetical protein
VSTTSDLCGQVALPLSPVASGRPTPDPDDPTWWKRWAACNGSDPAIFYPADVKRSGPETARFKAECLDMVVGGASPEDVALQMGCTAREIREWITKAGALDPNRRTANHCHASKRLAGHGRPGVEAAKAICRGCPVVGPCLDWAIANGELDGVWGCMDPEERRLEVRRRRRSTAA